MTMLRTLCVLALSTSLANGFAFLNAFPNQEAKNPNLASLAAKAPTGTPLNLRVNIGSDSGSQMSLQGLQLELSQEAASDEQCPKLPGANGPLKNVSAGAKAIVIKNDASFVGMSGHTSVPFRHGCWEMVWRENSPAGVIVCGFCLEETVQRNDASLEKGRIYFSFPVWTRETLEKEQEYRRKVEARAEKHVQEKLDAFKKMDETNNPIMKALHFRNAAHATEQLSYVPTEVVSQIPLDEDVMALKDNLMITTEGTMWRKDEASIFGTDQHTLLGTVTILPSTTLSP